MKACKYVRAPLLPGDYLCCNMGAPTIYRPGIFRCLCPGPHLFPCSSMHWTTVFFIDLPLHLPKSITSGSFSCCQSLVLPRLMVRYSWWRQSLGVIFMAPDLPPSIFDPLSCTGTQWIVDKVMVEHSLHSVLICDIHTARFSLDCSQAAVCPCTLFRVHCRPHSEGSVTSTQKI